MCFFSHDISTDYTDEYLRIGEDTTMEFFCYFCKVMKRVYGPTYLRAPNEEDTVILMADNEQRGWLGKLGSIDCMHWTCKNYPKSWQGL
jgi:hypothetical protein